MDTTRKWPMSPSEWEELLKDTKRLTGIDFMMMDVHRELDEENIHPETLLDKSARPQQEEHSDEESVGVSHEEAPSQRCEFCFGPMPCQNHINIFTPALTTRLDIDPIGVIAGANNADLTEVVVVGKRRDGKEYFASSIADGGTAMYHLQRGIYKLNRIIDGEHENENLGPPAA